MNNQPMVLNLTVKSPSRTEFSGQASAVTSFNMRGKFDVLPLHANFISLIEKMIIIHQHGKPDITIGVDKGVMKVTKDSITVLIGVQTIK